MLFNKNLNNIQQKINNHNNNSKLILIHMKHLTIHLLKCHKKLIFQAKNLKDYIILSVPNFKKKNNKKIHKKN